MILDFKDKIVIVTGGSRGIGAQMVRSFCENGAIVHFTYKSSIKEANEIVNFCKTRIFAHKVDSCVPSEIEDFILKIGKEHTKIDVLVNNAGIVIRSLLASLTEKDWTTSINTNLRAPFLYCTKAIRYLRKSDYPSIINISSVTADRASVGLGIYCATKAGLEALNKVLALELASYGIRTNTIAPGFIETEMSKNTSEEFKAKILSRTPLGRMGKTEEIANVAMFLASPLASYVTGAQIYVTGGRHLE